VLVLRDDYSNAGSGIWFPDGEYGSPAGGVNLPCKRLNKTRQQAIRFDRVRLIQFMKEVAMSGILKSSVQLFAEWRALLTPSGGGVLSPTAVALLGATGLYGGQKPKDDTAASDANILNTALGGEFGAVAAYQLAADSGLLQKPVRDLAMQFQGQHKAHADLLSKTVKTLGGSPAEPKKTADYKFPIETLKNQTDVLRFAAGLEQGAASGYLGMVPVLGDRDLAKAVASILGDEAMHWAILRHALGENPVPEPSSPRRRGQRRSGRAPSAGARSRARPKP
jgi:rubrerythrin